MYTGLPGMVKTCSMQLIVTYHTGGNARPERTTLMLLDQRTDLPWMERRWANGEGGGSSLRPQVVAWP